MENLSLQRKVFDLVLEKFPKRSKAVESLAKLLSVGKNAVYRRLRGDTLLTLGELYLISRHFDISLDSVFYEETDKIIFSYSFFTRQVSSFDTYIDQFYENAQEIADLHQPKIFYSSQEIPVFYYFSSPLVFAFKMYVYGLTYWELSYLQDRKFSFSLVSNSVSAKAQKISNIYNLIPGWELWSPSGVANTLTQLEYFATVDKFENPSDALVICDALKDLINHIRKMAKAGKKFPINGTEQAPGGEFHLYYNDFSRTNETILIDSGNGKALFTTFGTPNYLKTFDSKLCDQIQEWLKSVISRSTSLSVHSAKERDSYFNQLERQITQCRDRIERLIDNH